MDDLTQLEKLKADVKRLEGENRRWEETQSDKLDAKSEKALDFYRNERASTLKNRADEIADIAKKIEALEKKKETLEKSIPEYIKYSDSMINRFSSPTIITPERIRRNDDNIKEMNRKIILIEMNMANQAIVNSRSPQDFIPMQVIWNADGEPDGLRPRTPPSDTWMPNPSQEVLDMEEQIRIARATRVREPEN